jgi:NAD(P)-dependent dehydrogenase (short-subunit alcohol dehydrogenase family)
VLCVNAGIGLGGPFAETDLQRELKMVDLNVRGAIQLTKLVLKDMVARDRGKLLFTSSISATMPGSSVDPLTLCLFLPADAHLLPARWARHPAVRKSPQREAMTKLSSNQGRRRHVLSGARCVGRLHTWQDGRRRAGSQAFSFSSWAMSRSH